MSTRTELRAQLQHALQQSVQLETTSANFWLRRAQGKRHGEFSSNAALVMAAQNGEDVSILTTRMLKHLPQGWQERHGFLNFHMNDELLRQATERALREGERFGAGTALAGKRIVVEFVSADPSGPLPFGLGRIAAVGDAICRLLTWQGANVTREFYLNDDQTSAKMRLLGESIASHYLTVLGQEHEPPEGVLNDRFVRDIAETIAREDSNKYLLLPDEERSSLFAQRARDTAVAAQKAVLTRFGVNFDVWTSEAALAREGRVEAALRKLRERGHVYSRDGAEWLRTTQFGDETDRVLVRANGRPTYLASDIAYHVFKNERGFDVLLNIWTGEHRPYIERTRAALLSAGCDASRLEVLPCEGARFLQDGRPVSRGRGGGSFTLDEALDELDAETLRFLFLRHNPDERVAVDDEIARRDDETNPAYAARLVPARLRTFMAEVEANTGNDTVEGANEYSAEERELARLVALWPDTAENAALEKAPQRVAAFLAEMANATRALLASTRPTTSKPALDVLRAAQITALNALRVLGMSGDTRL